VQIHATVRLRILLDALFPTALTMKLATLALFFMLSLFFVSALDQQKQAEDPSMKVLEDDEEEEAYPFDEEDYEEENADAADRATKNRDLGYGYGYNSGYHRSYGGYAGHSYSYGSHHYTRPAVVYHEPRVVRRYYNYYRGRSKGKGRS
jgi:hypothetical protein